MCKTKSQAQKDYGPTKLYDLKVLCSLTIILKPFNPIKILLKVRLLSYP